MNLLWTSWMKNAERVWALASQAGSSRTASAVTKELGCAISLCRLLTFSVWSPEAAQACSSTRRNSARGSDMKIGKNSIPLFEKNDDQKVIGKDPKSGISSSVSQGSLCSQFCFRGKFTTRAHREGLCVVNPWCSRNKEFLNIP